MGIIVIDRTIKSIAILLTIINFTITNIRVVFVFSPSVLLVSLLKKRYKILGKGTLHISSTNNVCSILIPRVVLNGLMLFCILYVGFCVTKKINWRQVEGDCKLSHLYKDTQLSGIIFYLKLGTGWDSYLTTHFYSIRFDHNYCREQTATQHNLQWYITYAILSIGFKFHFYRWFNNGITVLYV